MITLNLEFPRNVDTTLVPQGSPELDFKQIYLNYGVFKGKDGEWLFKAMPGNFASTNWTISDAKYHDTLGQKFSAITADDGQRWNLNRCDIRRLKDLDEYLTLLDKACPLFKLHIELHDIINNLPSKTHEEAIKKYHMSFDLQFLDLSTWLERHNNNIEETKKAILKYLHE